VAGSLAITTIVSPITQPNISSTRFIFAHPFIFYTARYATERIHPLKYCMFPDAPPIPRPKTASIRRKITVFGIPAGGC
jgi:hypothetical protein